MEVDHVYPSTGQDADAGKHKKVTLIEQADIGSGSTGKCAVGAQTVSGKPELVFTDEDDNDVVVTNLGKLNYLAILPYIYPIGTVLTFGVSTNPATLLGFGTWTAIEGQVIVGKAASGTFDTLNATGGNETRTATGTTDTYTGTAVTTSPGAGSSCPTTTHTHTFTSGSFSVLQPYIVKYIWERTA
jgi:hypothetical protein